MDDILENTQEIVFKRNGEQVGNKIIFTPDVIQDDIRNDFIGRGLSEQDMMIEMAMFPMMMMDPLEVGDEIYLDNILIRTVTEKDIENCKSVTYEKLDDLGENIYACDHPGQERDPEVEELLTEIVSRLNSIPNLDVQAEYLKQLPKSIRKMVLAVLDPVFEEGVSEEDKAEELAAIAEWKKEILDAPEGALLN
jgi:hypothetical protein